MPISQFIVRARARLFVVCSLAAWLVTGMVAADPNRGRPLAKALEELRAGGLSIIYTTNLVVTGMRVARELPVGDPQSTLDTLLAPHGLWAREAEGGHWVVVPKSTPSDVVVVAGVVRNRDAQPVAGARVRIAEPPMQATTDERGHFRLAPVAPGPLAFDVTRSGFLPQSFIAEGTPGKPLVFDVTLVVMPVELDTIVVTPSRVRLIADRPSMLGLDRESLAELPQLANDALRALSVFPGTSGSERSAGLNVRGGRQDEVMVLLDGLEIIEPFHLKEFDSALSIVAPGTIEGIELMTGAFPADYGDRMSGVIELTTVAVGKERRIEVGLSAIDLRGLGAATIGDQARVLASVRSGSLEPAFEVSGEEDNPRFFDLFGKAGWGLGDRNDVRVQALVSNDDLDFVEGSDAEEERIRNSYRNAYLWGTHQAVLGPGWLVETMVSGSRLTLDRLSRTADAAGQRALMDERDVTILGLRQGWSRRLGKRHAVRWGIEVRDVEADYQYRDERQFHGPLAQALGRENDGVRVLDQPFRGQHYALHVTERWRPTPSLTLDLGARFDESALRDDEFVSPRLSLAWQPQPSTTVRLAWGHFYQSHRPNELRVEDGERAFQPAERAEHRIIGVDHRFEGAGWASKAGLRMRIEVYDRDISNPRSRYENLFEPLSLVPELEPDRVAVIPGHSRSRGLEVLIRARSSQRMSWLVAYTRSRTEDRIDDDWVPRGIDQPHALNAALDLDLGWGIRLNAAWRYHTGWPTTGATAELAMGEAGPVALLRLGPRFQQRLPDYHRLDVRFARTWNLQRGKLEAFFEVQNAYQHRNVIGFEVDLLPSSTDEAEAELTPILGNTALPWAGVVWRF